MKSLKDMAGTEVQAHKSIMHDFNQNCESSMMTMGMRTCFYDSAPIVCPICADPLRYIDSDSVNAVYDDGNGPDIPRITFESDLLMGCIRCYISCVGCDTCSIVDDNIWTLVEDSPDRPFPRVAGVGYKHLRMMQFMGHCGFSTDGKTYYRTRTGDVGVCPDTNPDDVRYDVSDKNIYYVDVNGWHITGPDGGYPTFWRCDVCQELIDLHDK